MKFILRVSLIVPSIILIFLFYKSQIVYDGVKNSYYLKYYLISFTFFFYILILNFIPYKISKILILYFYVVITSFYLFEIFITLKNNEISISIPSIEVSENEYEKRDLHTFYKEEIKDNPLKTIAAYPSTYLTNNYIEQLNLDFFPLSGISNKITYLCNENGYFSSFKSDDYGFNNPNSIWKEEVIDIVLIGDSFVQGSCVNSPNDLGGSMRKLSKKNILNLGYGGNGPLLQLATIKEYLPILNVNYVLWFFTESNDLTNLKNEIQNSKLKYYLNEESASYNIINKQHEVDKISNFQIENEYIIQTNKIYKQDILKNKLFNILKLSSTRRLLFNNNKKDLDFINYKKILIESQRFLKNNNSILIFVYLPDYIRYTDINHDFDYIYKNILNLVSELQIPIIDIHKLFSKSNDPLNFFPSITPGGHYNEIGYETLSKYILQKLNEKFYYQ